PRKSRRGAKEEQHEYLQDFSHLVFSFFTEELVKMQRTSLIDNGAASDLLLKRHTNELAGEDWISTSRGLRRRSFRRAWRG
ncbi:MAG: hypothetical protein IJ822_01095, partial [Pyramidobacter sp.]|nr:hypothetical protein [Pyramidobacter sp.]